MLSFNRFKTWAILSYLSLGLFTSYYYRFFILEASLAKSLGKLASWQREDGNIIEALSELAISVGWS